MKKQFRRSGFHIVILLFLSVFLAGFAMSACMRDQQGNDRVVKVSLDEYAMDVAGADDLMPGPAVIEITNRSREEHSFVFEGTDKIQRLEENIKPGETETIRVELEPTSYNVYCPIDDHKNKGMSSVIKVQEPQKEDKTASN